MIVSFRDKRTREFAEGNRVKAFFGFEHKAEMKLDELESATSIIDLDLPEIVWRRSRVIAGDNIGSASTISGGFALSGQKAHRDRSMLKSSITIE